jgi:predicted HTH transcriptional regulator
MEKKMPDSFVENRLSKRYPTEVGAPKFEPDNISLFKLEKTSKVKKYYSSKFEEMAKEYESLMNEISINERLYKSSHNFEPTSGEIYHLYKKESGEEFLSLISPDQWKKFEFIGSYKFLSDGRWVEI